MIKSNQLLILIFFFISTTISAIEKDVLLFSIENQLFTTIDLNQRVTYLYLFENIEERNQNLDNNAYIKDLISISIYNKFSIKNSIIIKEETIENYYNQIINNFEKRNKINYIESNHFNNISKQIILNNIKYDLQRRNILKNLLKQNNINYINTSDQNDILNIFDVVLNYFIIQNIFKKNVEEIYDILINKESILIKEILTNKKIDYDYNKKEILNFKNIDNNIKEKIINNKNNFIIYHDSYFLIGKIEKKLKKNIGLKYSFFLIKFNNETDLSDKEIVCNNINNLKSNKNLEINKHENIEISKLNTNIIENLSKKNDKIIIKNNNQQNLFLLCNIEYDINVAMNLLKQENIQEEANKIDNEFINTKKREYNFKLYIK